MPVIGFSVFKDKILNGSKRQTIRPLRKHPIKVGEKLYLFWHLRRKDCVKLMEATCRETFFVEMFYSKVFNAVSVLSFPDHVTGQPVRRMGLDEIEDLARKDGFENAREMMDWFNEKYCMDEMIFQVIRWNEDCGPRCPVCGSPVHSTADPKKDLCINAKAHNGQPYFLFRNHAREEFPEPSLDPVVERQLAQCCSRKNCEG